MLGRMFTLRFSIKQMVKQTVMLQKKKHHKIFFNAMHKYAYFFRHCIFLYNANWALYLHVVWYSTQIWYSTQVRTTFMVLFIVSMWPFTAQSA